MILFCIFSFSVTVYCCFGISMSENGFGMKELGRKFGYGLDSLVRVCVASGWSVGF